MIEEVPLSLVFHDGMVIGPASILMLFHDDTFVFIRSHRLVAHGISETFGAIFFAYPRVSEVKLTISLECERTFLEAFGQSFHCMTVELHAVWRFSWVLQFLVSKLDEIVFQSCHTQSAASPEDDILAIGGLKHTRVDACNAFYIIRQGFVWPIRMVGCRHSDTKSVASCILVGGERLRSIGEKEIVFAIFLYAVRCPHRVSLWVAPWHLLLGKNHSVVGPVGEIIGREDMIVCHGKPFLFWFHGTDDVVRWKEVDSAIEYPCCWVCRKLVIDNRILRFCSGDSSCQN